jgi:glycosyltransferase involved in cell wall biosynthesis
MIDVSIVVPLFNEVESIGELAEWIDRVCKENELSYEVVMIDDGSNDGSWQKIEALNSENPHIKGIKFRRNYGKSAALNTAFEAVEGKVVITMDADLQDSPDEIPGLRNMIIDEGYDLVSGWKQKRHDPIMKTGPTKLFNAATRRMSGIKLHDFNCGLKAYRVEVVKNIEVYGEMHRYIPLLAKWAGFDKIGEKVVEHRARQYGVTKFGLERFVNGFLDLLSITFVSRFGKRPMHFFGLLGTILMMSGFFMALWMGISKLAWGGTLITERPMFYIALVMAILGTQFFLTGFVAELVSRNNTKRNEYQIDNRLGLKDQ